NQFRQAWPNTQSLLMDEATLLAHQPLWGQEPHPTQAALKALTPAEASLYHALQHHRYGQAVRLEQERIGFGWLQQRLSALFHA
ncbi:MAG: Wadjet anti-phage system protein JetD domain-containing protein, partial [Hydrogenovibrio sp.]